MITSFYPPFNFGGDGIFVESLSALLADRGHQVTVVHCEDAFNISNMQKGGATPSPSSGGHPGVSVVRLTNRLGALSPLLSHQTGRPALKHKSLSSILRDDFDVINYHNVSLMGGPGVLKMGYPKVKLYTLHEHWLVCPTHILWKYQEKACDGRECLKCSLKARIPPQWWRYGNAVRSALKHVDCMISPSQFTARQHTNVLGNLPIKVLPHFSRIQPIEASQVRVGSGFLYVGRITESKGIAQLLQAFSTMPEQQITVVGSGDLLDTLRKRHRDEHNINFIAFCDADRLRQLYTDARALILPSLAPETFGLAIVEALACGTPSIVNDSGGCAEIVQSTQVGLVYRTQKQLVSAVQRLSEDVQFATEQSHLARQACVDYYLSSTYVDHYLEMINDLLVQKSSLK